MRIGNTFTNMMTSSSYRAYSSSSSSPSLHSPSPSSQHPRSPWHSPVPYLFGGLAAMLGLIAFALLILACSYWKLSGYLEGDNGGEDQGGNNEEEIVKVDNNRVFEEKFLVIMAGEVKPTHLATPSTSRTSSFGSEQQSEKSAETKAEEEEEEEEKGGPDGRRDHDGTSTDPGR